MQTPACFQSARQPEGDGGHPGARRDGTLQVYLHNRGGEGQRRAREVAADNGRRALALVRERAAGFGLAPGKVGMIGFSAGAFLVADVAMGPEPPDFGGDLWRRDPRRSGAG